MPLSIKNDDTERLARKVAEATGETLTEAIHRALEDRWRRLTSKRHTRVLNTQIEELLRRVDSLPTLDARRDDEILGYDENGLPR